ncbi:hypothetical protein AltI4_25490 [Alteromonas sp. I4]|nr:hypothetical protein AltI4_25490 [Alteromonas sp. I4]
MGWFSSCDHDWAGYGNENRVGKGAKHKCRKCGKTGYCNADRDVSHNSSIDTSECTICDSYRLKKIGGHWV